MQRVGRRDLLVSFLGVAAATSACRRGERPRRDVPTRFVDGVHEVGHRLREAPPPLAMVDERVVDCLVVGGGAAGLSAAWRLRGAGVSDLLVVEVDEVEGGTARSGQNAVSRFPWGAHYLPAPLSAKGPVPKLLSELGVMTGVDDEGAPLFAEEALIHEPEERVYYRGHWYEGLYLRAGASADDLAQLKRFEAMMNGFAAARDARGRKAFAVPLELGSDDDEWTSLDRLSMASWLEQHGFTSPRLQWLVDYACRDDYGATAQDTSAWAGLWYFCARQSGAEKNEGFLSWPEGNGRLIRQLASGLGPQQVRRRTLVHTLEPVPGSTDWAAQALDAATGAPVRLRARQVVLATPRFIAARLLAPWRSARPSFLDAFVTGPWTVANLTLSQRPKSRGFPLAWDNVVHESRSLGYVVATHQSLQARTTGPTVLTWYYPHDGRDTVAERKKLLATTPEEWAQVVLGDLSPAHLGFEAMVESIEVMRWGHAMVRPVPGFLWGSARRDAQRSLGPSLHFAHSDLGGLALFEEANWHGVRAAEQVLTGLGRPGPSWLDAG
ncbi:MAG: FAD-dependent oxidoreductase [Myxococcaceae bacterium]|nr:FAD-dependent oxidoreductase [Myxococcaceae bacterium]